MSDAARLQLRLRISGRVQGVWYRGWMEAEARRAGIAGWVRNRSDGSVEAVVAGDAATVRRLIAQCRRGPPAARVERIEERPEPGPPPIGFRVRPTV